ncbi:DoxX family protein [Terriglobus aquaticus]|uniref:DoxX family protein n=1 Tax=Terriglobus aquaticus TaxID=940139 RepID=A0ABW9KL80_9BACT|nr:DoxX family protein [Terriglobus aquaticus]
MSVSEAVHPNRPSKAARLTGWILSALIAVFIGSGGINALRGAKFVVDGAAKMGFPASAVTAMGIAEILCVVFFLIPRTAALGAILFTSFFGGAVATHARAGQSNWPVPVLFAVVVWVALILRDPRFHIIRPSQYGRGR